LTPKQWLFIENCFLSVFILELVLRTCKSGPRHMAKTTSTYFDVSIIGISALDNFLLSGVDPHPEHAWRRLAESRDGFALPSASIMLLRVIRLARVVRLLRVVKALKELWILMCGLLNSLRALLWTTLMICIILYISAIVMVTLLDIQDSEELSVTADRWLAWGTVPRAMWTLLKVATFDDWMETVKPVADDAKIIVFIGVFVCITNLGLMNMLIGIMCSSAMVVKVMDNDSRLLKQRLATHGVLVIFRKFLLQQRPVYHRWTISELLDELHAHHTSARQVRKELGNVSIGSDFLRLVWETIESIETRGWLHADEFVMSLLSFGTNPRTMAFDYLELNTVVRSLEEGCQELEKSCAAVAAELLHTLIKATPYRQKMAEKDKKILFNVLLQADQLMASSCNRGQNPDEENDNVKVSQVAVQNVIKPDEDQCLDVEDVDMHVIGLVEDIAAVVVAEAEASATEQMNAAEEAQGTPALVVHAAQVTVDQVGHVAEATVGQVGQVARATVDQVGQVAKLPMAVGQQLNQILEDAENKIGMHEQHTSSAAEASLGCSSAQDQVGDMEENDRSDAKETYKARVAAIRFDAFFGFLLVVNALLIGIQVDDKLATADPLRQRMWYYIDCCFSFMFTSEIVLRILMVRSTKFWAGCFPQVFPCRTLCHRFRVGWHYFRRDYFNIFDVLIVGICLIDNAILEYAVSDDGANGAKALDRSRIIRIFRLVKVARIARMFKLTTELHTLVSCIAISMRTVIWTVVLITGINYLGAIVLGEIYDFDPWVDGNAALVWKEHDNIPRMMLFLANLSTLDGWGQILQARWDTGHHLFTVLLFLLMVFNGLGVLNLIVGVMCEAALTVVETIRRKDREKYLGNLKFALARLTEDMQRQTGDSRLLTREHLAKALSSKRLTQDLRKANLQLCDVWSIFDRLSSLSANHAKHDDCKLADFISSCLRFSMPVRTTDLIAVRAQISRYENQFDLVLLRFTRLAADARAALPMILAPVREKPMVPVPKYLAEFLTEAGQMLAWHEYSSKVASKHFKNLQKRGIPLPCHLRDSCTGGKERRTRSSHIVSFSQPEFVPQTATSGRERSDGNGGVLRLDMSSPLPLDMAASDASDSGTGGFPTPRAPQQPPAGEPAS